MPKYTYNTCDDCLYGYSKQNQESSMCKICEFKKYRDLEEQGLLLKLPCKVGDSIYKIPSKVNYDLNIISGYSEDNRVYEQKVYSVQMWSNNRFTLTTCEGLHSVSSESYKETWFLTKAEAEEALKKMEG